MLCRGTLWRDITNTNIQTSTCYCYGSTLIMQPTGVLQAETWVLLITWFQLGGSELSKWVTEKHYWVWIGTFLVEMIQTRVTVAANYIGECLPLWGKLSNGHMVVAFCGSDIIIWDEKHMPTSNLMGQFVAQSHWCYSTIVHKPNLRTLA